VIVRELITLLSFRVEENGLQAYDKSMGSLLKNLLKLITVAAGAVTALAAVGRVAGENALELLRLAEAYDTTTESLQRIPLAARAAGFDIKAVRTELSEFYQLLREARLQPFGEAGTALNRLGVGITNSNGELRETEQILMDVARATQGLDERMRFLTLGRLFGDEDSQLASFIRRGGNELEEYLAKVDRYTLVVGEKALRANANWAISFRLITDYISAFIQDVSGSVTPAFQGFLDGALEFMRVNRELAKLKTVEFFHAMAGIFRTTAKSLRDFWETVEPVIMRLGGLERIVRVLIGLLLIGAGGGLLALIAALSVALYKLGIAAFTAQLSFLVLPFLIGAAAVALYLFLDDLDAWLHGQKSVLGELLGDWKSFEVRHREIIDGLRNTFGGLNDVFRGAFQSDLALASQGTDKFIEGLKGITLELMAMMNATDTTKASTAEFFSVLSGDTFWDDIFSKLETFVSILREVDRQIVLVFMAMVNAAKTATSATQEFFSVLSGDAFWDSIFSKWETFIGILTEAERKILLVMSYVPGTPGGKVQSRLTSIPMSAGAGAAGLLSRFLPTPVRGAAGGPASPTRVIMDLNISGNGTSLNGMAPEQRAIFNESVKKAAREAFEEALSSTKPDFPQLE